MPVYLPPLSRRKFIARTVAAAAGLMLPRAWAGRPATDPDYWAFFSDVHISGDAAKVARDTNMTDHFKAVVAELLAQPDRPAAVLISGDCAFNSGEQEDYAAFKKLLQPLRENKLPIHITLGNHDHREHWDVLLKQEPKLSTASPVSGRQVFLLKSKRVNWFVLDTLEKTNSTPGFLGDDQLAWLAKTLDANKRKPAVVVAHHHLQFDPNGHVGGLKDTDKLLEVIRPRRQVKAYVYGHTHNWHVTKDESDIHLVNLPPTAYVFTPGKPSGWVRAHLRDNGMKLQLHCLDKKHEQNGQMVDLQWRA